MRYSITLFIGYDRIWKVIFSSYDECHELKTNWIRANKEMGSFVIKREN